MKKNPDRHDFDELEFKKLVNKYLKDEYTHAQAQYLAYQEMGEKVPDEVAKEVRDEEMTLDMVGGYIPLKCKKKIVKMNPKSKPNPIKKQITASGDLRVFRTEDDKFVIVKKEKGCYGVYPEGNQFKRVGTANKKDAVAKAVEILSRKNNPTPGMGIKRKKESINEVGDDIKELVANLYTSGESIERIARRCDINQVLVKQILSEKKVPVRKGGWKDKVKSNPLLRSKQKFFNDIFENIVEIYKDIKDLEFDTEETRKNLEIVTWAQGVFLGYKDNATMTALMLQRIYDMKSYVPDMSYQVKRILRMVFINNDEADKRIKKIKPGSIALKALQMFDPENPNTEYFKFMVSRKSNFYKNFFSLRKQVALIDFVNFMRFYSIDRYDEPHDVFIQETVNKIVKNLNPSEFAGQELIYTSEKVNALHKEAMAVIDKTREFIEELTNDVKDGHDPLEFIKTKYEK
jgi:hypothetical protein